MDNSELNIYTDNNVYILGAGFSCDAGIPVLSKFLNCMRDCSGWLRDNNRDEFRAVENVFRFRQRATSAANRIKINVENIEDLFSLAAAIEGNSLEEDVKTAIAATLDYARTNPAAWPKIWCLLEYPGQNLPQWFKKATWDIYNQNTYTCSPYHLYAGVISRSIWEPISGARNTVITFNYDTVLEEAVHTIGVKYTYGFPSSLGIDISSSHSVQIEQEQGAMPILKLHGSVNWGLPNQGEGPMKIFNTYEEVCGAGHKVVLIPPTWRKVFDDPLTKVWEGAVKALTEATRIVVIGFSMPPTDIHFKYLLAAGLQDNISLRKFLFVNPDRKAFQNNLQKIVNSELTKQGILLPPAYFRTDEFFFGYNGKDHLNLIDFKWPPGYPRIDIMDSEEGRNRRTIRQAPNI